MQNHARATSHRPELVLNNFDTRLGHRVGRMFASLFHQDPTFRGRRVVTFHNQRDFIFFRHHRYIFEERQKKEKGKKEKVNYVKARLQVSQRRARGGPAEEGGGRYCPERLRVQRLPLHSRARGCCCSMGSACGGPKKPVRLWVLAVPHFPDIWCKWELLFSAGNRPALHPQAAELAERHV